VLQDLLERLSTHLVHAPKSTLSTEDRWDAALDEHERLVRAIEDQDEQAARAIAREHMETARRLRLQLLRKTALQQPPADPIRSR
jgi:DNA-binding FadR family transcriptional regulator